MLDALFEIFVKRNLTLQRPWRRRSKSRAVAATSITVFPANALFSKKPFPFCSTYVVWIFIQPHRKRSVFKAHPSFLFPNYFIQLKRFSYIKRFDSIKTIYQFQKSENTINLSKRIYYKNEIIQKVCDAFKVSKHLATFCNGYPPRKLLRIHPFGVVSEGWASGVVRAPLFLSVHPYSLVAQNNRFGVGANRHRTVYSELQLV